MPNPSRKVAAPATPPKSDERRKATADTEAFTPELGVRATRPQPAPRVEPTAPFLLVHHPQRWTVMAGRVIPQLGKLKLQPGVNGVEQEPRTGKPIPGPAIAEAREKGFTVIPWDVDGAGTTYLKRPTGTTDVVLLRFERCYPGSAQIDCDEAGYVAWCRGLIDRKVLQPPPVYALERMAADLRKNIDDLDGKHGVQSLVKRFTRDLEGVEQELELRRREEAPADSDDLIPEVAEKAEAVA